MDVLQNKKQQQQLKKTRCVKIKIQKKNISANLIRHQNRVKME